MLEKDHPKIKWFENARLGMFIHWGLYSATEGIYAGKETKGIVEWIQSREQIPISEYEKFAENLSTDNFDAESIAKLAKEAGMKYMVFTAKHHEGFAMYDTAWDDYSIMKRCNSKIDPVAYITSAMRKEGIKPCLYYSQALDFHEENATGNTWDFDTPEDERDFESYINGKSKYQIKELLTNYGDISMLWFDVPRGITAEIGADIRNYVQSINPDCLINGRLSFYGGSHDYICMGDNEVPSGKQSYCAETCATTNDSWGYKRYDKNFKKPEDIIKLLCSLVSKGVNLLLNIGPKPDGSIPEECVVILKELARWMKVNSEAIYETKASPFEADFSFGYAAQKNNCFYLYIDNAKKSINICGLENRILSAKTMKGESVPFVQYDADTTFDLEGIEFDSAVTVIKLELDGQPRVRDGIFQQEKEFISLPCCACQVLEFEEATQSKKTEDFDNKVGEASVAVSGMKIDLNGKVVNWKSTENYISWDAEITCPGEYEAVIYTVTSKYQPWIGKHKILVRCGENSISNELGEDVIPDGVNRKYFSETGSRVGFINIKEAGVYRIDVRADEINKNDPVGLSVTRMVLIKK